MLLTLLNTALHDQSVQPGQNVTVLELKNVRTKVKALEALFKRFEDIPKHSAESPEVQDVAMDLITRMHDLASQMQFKSALESSLRLNPGLKSSLPEAVGKLGRYFSISYELVCAVRSREYSMFNRITIEASRIRVPSQRLNVDKNIHPLTALNNILQSRTAVQSKALRPSLERCLKKPLQDILDDFHLIITNYYQFAKVHAEIQLLFFYEMNLGRLRPRVICSNKSACYLCNLFFKLHGQFDIPRTHGRLYYKWTLPDWHILLPETRRRDFNVLLRQFSDMLKVQVRAALERRPTRVHHPNESVLVMPAHWSSSNITQALPSISESVTTVGVTQTQEQLPEILDSVIPNCPISAETPFSLGSTNPDIHSFQPPLQSELLTAAMPSSSPSIPPLHPTGQEPASPRDLPPPAISADPLTESPHTPLNHSSPTTPKPFQDLIPGEPIWHQLSYPHISINIGTTRLHLHLSCDVTRSPDPNMLSNPNGDCWVRVKWLQDPDMENVNSQAVNVEDLAYDTEMRLHHGAACTPTELYLRRGEDVVSIKYAFDEPR